MLLFNKRIVIGHILNGNKKFHYKKKKPLKEEFKPEDHLFKTLSKSAT